MRSWRERFDPMLPVVVRRADLRGEAWGDTTIGKRKGEPAFIVRLERTLSAEAQLFTLVHELAHCLQWRVNEDARANDHDAEWGVAYARIWRQMFGS